MKNRTFTGILCRLLPLVLLVVTGEVVAQNSIRLREAGTARDKVEVEVGETVTIDVFADLGNVDASGISVFVTVPAEVFLVVDQVPIDVNEVEDLADTTFLFGTGVQPFRSGPLFVGAGESRNVHFSAGELTGVPDDVRVIEHQLLFGLTGDRSVTGSGVVGSFQITPIKPVQDARIIILDNPNQETRITTPEGGERRFNSAPQGMEINVLGLELFDIPDVILLPGVADSIQIGLLDQYVENTLSGVDELTWSFSPPHDSLEIVIGENRVVKITPLFDWSGRHRVVWTATDSNATRFYAGPPPSATDVSDLVVNNPPSFSIERDADGVKRDSVSFEEDAHPFIGDATLERARAFRGQDLNILAFDPDPEERLDFAVTSFSSNPNVRGNDDPNSGDLLLWSRPNFSGIDSVQVIAQDQSRGRDTLRVIVTVIEVEDAPEFILDDVNPRIGRGNFKEYEFDELVRDVDTELDSLIFTFVNDLSDHFVVDTLRVDGKKVVRVTGSETFTGTGTVQFNVEDPQRPDLNDSIILFFTSADALPPDVLPFDLKIDLIPGGAREVIPLDGLVVDPDNDDDELTWSVPPLTFSTIDVDQIRQLLVQAPGNFVGFEAVELTVSDPADQSDVLPLRIYSSDGRPVAGGIPDVVLEKGEEDQETDLDNYYFDADNTNEDVQWTVVDVEGRPFSSENLQVSIDRLTHVITYFATESGASLTETVILRVSDPTGNESADTVQVAIVSEGDLPPGKDTFSISPPLPDEIQIVVSDAPDIVLDLDNHLEVTALVSRDSITWELTNPGTLNGLVLAPGTTKLYVFPPEGEPLNGLDTISVAAVGPRGERKSAKTRVRYIPKGRQLSLRQIPDLQFVKGNSLAGLNLNAFIIDRETHPDSVMQWDFGLVGIETSILIRVNQDSLLTAFATDVDSADIVLTAVNVSEGVTARDTVRIFSIDAPVVELDPLPQLSIAAGSEDSSIVLNDFIPEDLDFVPTSTTWTVSNQTITLPFIEPRPPHLLRLSTQGNRVGIDTLNLTVDFGGGFLATGVLIAAVDEPLPDDALELHIIPNPAIPEFINVMVLSRKQLESSPTVVFSFGTADSTVAMRQIEDDLEVRKVLIWSGNVQIPPGATGTILFAAQALTALGSTVGATTSVSVATAVANKPLALSHGEVNLSLPADAITADTRLLLRAVDEVSTSEVGELTLKTSIGIYPLGLRLNLPALLRTTGSAGPADGLYRWQGGEWEYVGQSGDIVSLRRLGEYAVLADLAVPTIELVSSPQDGAELVVEVADLGSGVKAEDVQLTVGDLVVKGSPPVGAIYRWTVPQEIGAGTTVLITAVDRAGNRSERTFVFDSAPLPLAFELGDSFPNPFNPEVTIPFTVPQGAMDVHLVIYGVTGQVIRVLADRHIGPGRQRVTWDGTDAQGRRVSSGLYLYRLETETGTITKRMMLLK